MKKIFLYLIRFYRKYLSPLKGRPTCRFFPSCSSYAEQAITEWGAMRGGWMSLTRLLRCQPFCRGGYDPVGKNPENHPQMMTQRVPGFLSRRKENGSTLLCLYYAGRQRYTQPVRSLSEKQERS